MDGKRCLFYRDTRIKTIHEKKKKTWPDVARPRPAQWRKIRWLVILRKKQVLH